MNATLILNPGAGRAAGPDHLTGALHVLESHGWQVDVQRSRSPGDVTAIARDAVRKRANAVVVAGGDGTINAAVQALAGTDTALGYLPYGTVNVWAREVGIPLTARAAARSLVTGTTVTLDLGRADDRFFLLMAGIGFDAAVLQRSVAVERYKRRLGVIPYAAMGFATAASYRGIDVELRFDGLIRRVQAIMVVVGNTRLYGGRFRFTPDAVANDGQLDVCIVKGHGFMSLVRQTVPLVIEGSVAHCDVEFLRVRELTVQGDGRVPVQLDGELAGSTPTRFTVAGKTLRAIVPSDFSTELLA